MFRDSAEIILVADDDRRYTYVNENGSRALGVSAQDILGWRIEEFFSAAQEDDVPSSWSEFVDYGLQIGICRTTPQLGSRRFAYRAKANLAPDIHVSVLRELSF